MSTRSHAVQLLGALTATALLVAACSSSGEEKSAPPSSGDVGSTTTTVMSSSTTTVVARIASAKGMVAVPGGSYRVGSSSPNSEATAAKTVEVKAFFVDAFEVTNAEYRRFMDSQGAPAPHGWFRDRLPEGQESYAVAGVEWDWAQAYCIALAKRLPSDAEWEVAARGADARTFPWGEDPNVVDLDTEGARPIGAEARNVSPFGVHDTVGGVWEWVDQPYDTVAAGAKVRRGGEYGRVRNGSAFRQIVVPTNESVISETGFRCATDTADQSATPGQFSSDHPRPAPVSTTVPASASGAGGRVLRNDVFEDPRSGWMDQSDPKLRSPDYFIGYHAPGWYHVEASKPHVQVMSLAGLNFGDVAVEVKAYVDKIGSATDAQYRYGIAFRADGPLRNPPAGIIGPDRPRDFYAFAVNPRAGTWELLHHDTLPYRVVAQGPLPTPIVVTDPAKPDTLRVEAVGSFFRMYVNGVEAGAYDAHGFHVTGDVGMFTETLDETKAHVHFDSILVTELSG